MRGFEERGEGTSAYKHSEASGQEHRHTECSGSCDSEASGEEGGERVAGLSGDSGWASCGKSVLHLYTCLLNVFVEFVREDVHLDLPGTYLGDTSKRAFTVATVEAGRDDEVNGREFCYWTAKKKAAFPQKERKYDHFHRQCAFPEYLK